jgi:hypothetical protein
MDVKVTKKRTRKGSLKFKEEKERGGGGGRKEEGEEEEKGRGEGRGGKRKAKKEKYGRPTFRQLIITINVDDLNTSVKRERLSENACCGARAQTHGLCHLALAPENAQNRHFPKEAI